MEIRPYLAKEDLKSIIDGHESDVFKAPTDSMIKYGRILAAYEGGEPMAYVLALKEQDGIWYVPSLATKKEYMGRGVMKKLLLEAMMSWRAKAIWLEVHPDNVAARALYKSLGFTETEINVKYADGKKCLMCEVMLDR